jgi:hypothetical protein
MPWTDQSWARHLELKKLGNTQASELDHEYIFHGDGLDDADGQVTILNRLTAAEKTVPVTVKQRQKMLFGSTLMSKLDFLLPLP